MLPLKMLFQNEGLFSKSALTYTEKSCIAGFPWVWSARGILRKKGCVQVGHPYKGVELHVLAHWPQLSDGGDQDQL